VTVYRLLRPHRTPRCPCTLEVRDFISFFFCGLAVVACGLHVRLLWADVVQDPAAAMAACRVFQISSTCLPAMWCSLVSSLDSAGPCIPRSFSCSYVFL
jgi:hypothetical protein